MTLRAARRVASLSWPTTVPARLGTTTLATAVRRRFGASMVAGDDLYSDFSEQRRKTLAVGEGGDQYFDWKRLHC